MTTSTSSHTDRSSDRVLTITRTFNAPRETVFKAWTEADRLLQWCAPRGFTIPHSEGEIRPGGAWRTCMRSPDGVDYLVGGTYREVVPNERVVFTHVWDEGGTPGHETVVTVTFAEDVPGKTRMTFHQETFRSRESRDSHQGGWTETFDQLDAYLASA